MAPLEDGTEGKPLVVLQETGSFTVVMSFRGGDDISQVLESADVRKRIVDQDCQNRRVKKRWQEGSINPF